jgi:hypothetical protein
MELEPIDHYLEQAKAGRISRRDFMGRVSALGFNVTTAFARFARVGGGRT